MGETHYAKLAGKFEIRTSFPTGPFDGQMFYHDTTKVLYRYSTEDSKWYGVKMDTTTSTSTTTTSTSTSTTTTTTSTSTTTTSTSTSTTTSISTSTSTSTTTTV